MRVTTFTSPEIRPVSPLNNMYHADMICLDRVTGRKVWLLREIPTGRFGDDWVSSLVVVRAYWFCRDAELLLAKKFNSTAHYRALQKTLKTLNFTTAHATRHGRTKRYRV